ncbi:MAG: tyrosine-type recombinase/integrase [Pseudonocardiales bacterium]|nr:tyrosine-type recombinase/integrase [Pseudonocardiales bacterium]MBV9652742.1 tyrosine-type recombinase/integrase [Pseudonocardiales bacterium]
MGTVVGLGDGDTAAGLPHTRLHNRRHTAGTLLISQDVHLRVVQKILGHTDIWITQKNTHVSSAHRARRS